MALWMVRAGSRGEREEFALENKLALIGWEELSDLSNIIERSELHSLLHKLFPNEKPNSIRNWEGQIWQFTQVIKEGDLIALPLKQRSVIAIGECAGKYQFIPGNPPDARHVRPIKEWKEFPRNRFDKDLLFSFGALQAVCNIQRHDAEERVKAIMNGKPPSIEPVIETLDLEQAALDQISSRISTRFRGHAILEAQGYLIRVSPEGPDGGVDIVAGRGSLGFEQPRLVVQVKSQDNPIDVGVLRELSGVMKGFGADLGLIVAWGGYRGVVEREAARQFFDIRLWDAQTVVRMVQENYDNLPKDIQADLPMKRIWMLVPEEEEE
jgi:restriction system protein